MKCPVRVEYETEPTMGRIEVDCRGQQGHRGDHFGEAEVTFAIARAEVGPVRASAFVPVRLIARWSS